MSEPTTEAGRALLTNWAAARTHPPSIKRARDFLDLVLAIEAEARASQPLTLDVERLQRAAVFMLELVDVYYGTDHEFDLPDEAEFRQHRAVIERLSRP